MPLNSKHQSFASHSREEFRHEALEKIKTCATHAALVEWFMIQMDDCRDYWRKIEYDNGYHQGYIVGLEEGIISANQKQS